MAFTEFHEWLEALHAQPRFGPGDRAGTANFIDAAAPQPAGSPASPPASP